MGTIAGHFIKKCKVCGVIIAQCRCPSSDKKVILDYCDCCKRRQEKIDKIKKQEK